MHHYPSAARLSLSSPVAAQCPVPLCHRAAPGRHVARRGRPAARPGADPRLRRQLRRRDAVPRRRPRAAERGAPARAPDLKRGGSKYERRKEAQAARRAHVAREHPTEDGLHVPHDVGPFRSPRVDFFSAMLSLRLSQQSREVGKDAVGRPASREGSPSQNVLAALCFTLSRGLRATDSKTTTRVQCLRGHSHATIGFSFHHHPECAKLPDAQSWASSACRDDARGQRGRERAAVAPDDNSTYNQPELRRDDDAADHLAAVVAAKAIAVLAAVSPQRE